MTSISVSGTATISPMFKSYPKNLGESSKFLPNIGRRRRTKPRKIIDAVRRISHVRIDYQGNRPAGVGERSMDQWFNTQAGFNLDPQQQP